MANLYLSHWNAAEKVYVPVDICRKLKPYHLSIVRSLYRCWKKNLNGAILNYDEGIDIPLAIQALWQALINADKVKLPFLIIVSDKKVILWHFYLSQLGEVTILNSQNVEMVSKNKHFSIILVPQSNIKLLKACEENDYSFIVVEDIDNIATSRLFKTLSGRFNIALTRRNFLVNRDCKILWHILNWINPNKFGKLNEFPRFDQDHLENLRNPYEDVWYTYNCNVGEYDLDKGKDEKEQFEKLLNEWAVKHDFLNNDSEKRPLRKRKSNSKSDAKSKRSKKKNSNKDYHEQPTQIVGNRQQDESDKNICEDDEKRMKLRDISDLSYSLLVTTSHEAPSSSNKEIEIKPAFKSAFVKRKSFDFKIDRQNKVMSKESNDNEIASSKSIKDHVFPSLEDIFKFKKKNLEVSTPIAPTARESNVKLSTHQLNTNSNKGQISNGDPPDLVCVSLEEIFKCKRKLHDTSEATKKLHVDNSTSKPAIVNNNSKNFTSVPLHAKNDYHSHRKQESFSSNANRAKVFGNQYKIIHKNGKQAATTCSKGTQTSTGSLLALNLTSEYQKKDIAVDTAEMGITSGKDIDEGDSGNDNNSNRGLEDAESIKQGKDADFKNIQITDKVKESEDSTASASIRGSPLQNLTNMGTDDLVKDEDGGILLSIIEEKFMSQSSLNVNEDIKHKLNKTHDINGNRTSSNFARYNSQVLLESLFGESAFESSENNDDGSEDDLFSKLHQSISDTLLHNSLRVKTIDQINEETSSQLSQSTCDSMRILFGVDNDACSNIISRNDKLCAHKYEKHHLLSSLFG